MSDRLNDLDRLQEIHDLDLFSDGVRELLDGFARQAAEAFELETSAVTLVLDEAQYFAGRHGFDGWIAEAGGTPVEWSFCQWVVKDDAPFVVEDAREHERMKSSPLVQEEGVRCYAGVPIVTSRGFNIGSMCVKGTDARSFSQEEIEHLKSISAAAVEAIEARRAKAVAA